MKNRENTTKRLIIQDRKRSSIWVMKNKHKAGLPHFTLSWLFILNMNTSTPIERENAVVKTAQNPPGAGAQPSLGQAGAPRWPAGTGFKSK